ncbi:MAG: hypothetical protein D6694_11665, partial [Gammaproteobacteria bacterium]
VQRTRLRRAPTSAEFRSKIMRHQWPLDGDAAPLTLTLGVGWVVPALAALVAAYFSARHAERIPPAQVLRGE